MRLKCWFFSGVLIVAMPSFINDSHADSTSTNAMTNQLNEDTVIGSSDNNGQQVVVSAPNNQTVVANNPTDAKDFASAWGVAFGVGTLGVGFNLAHAVYDDYLDLRGQYNYFPLRNFTMNSDVNGQNVPNQANLTMDTLGLLLDYKPFGGVFRLTGGMYYDNRSAIMSGPSIDFGGTTGSGTAGFQYSNISPYLGIGLGSFAASTESKKGFLIAFDAGLMFAKANSFANVTCTSTTPGACDNFNQQVNDYLNQVNNFLATFPYYPVVSLALGYRF